MIRIFGLPNCQKLYELHRGTSPCTIFSLSFNFDASFLAISSSRGTVHVFNIIEAAKVIKEEEDKKTRIDHNGQRWYDGLLSTIKSSRKDRQSIPIIIRSVAKIRFKKPTAPNTISMLPIGEDSNCVAICFEDGKLLMYAIANTSRMKKSRPRPVLADDIMFDNECVE